MGAIIDDMVAHHHGVGDGNDDILWRTDTRDEQRFLYSWVSKIRGIPGLKKTLFRYLSAP
jgi:hypothetical protein